MVLFQALCLGLAATAVGLLVGLRALGGVFHQPTGYLAEAFTLSGGTVVGAGPLLVASVGGVLATCLASAIPLLDLRRGRARDAVYREAGVPGNALVRAGTQRWLFAAAVRAGRARERCCSRCDPRPRSPRCAMLAAATVLAVPLDVRRWCCARARCSPSAAQRLTVAAGGAGLAARRARSARSRSRRRARSRCSAASRSAARAMTCCAGSRTFAHSYVADAPIWVTNPGDNQAADTFDPGASAAAIARVPAVASVRAFQGGFLDARRHAACG